MINQLKKLPSKQIANFKVAFIISDANQELTTLGTAELALTRLLDIICYGQVYRDEPYYGSSHTFIDELVVKIFNGNAIKLVEFFESTIKKAEDRGHYELCYNLNYLLPSLKSKIKNKNLVECETK